MSERWQPVCPAPTDLVTPRPIDPKGVVGPTTGQARGPRWRRTSPRLYVPASVDDEVVEQRILEQAQRLPDNGAVTGWAALRLHGGGFFDGLDSGDLHRLPVPLAVPRSTRVRFDPAFIVVRSDVPSDERAFRHGIRCTTVVRALFDEVRRRDELRAAVAAVDMVLAARLAKRRELLDYADGCPGRPGSRLFANAVALSVDRSRSPKESELRLIWILDAGLPSPRCNWPVADESGRFIGKPDLLCDELGVYGEFDGADHRGRERHRRDVTREDLFRRTGLEGFTVVGAEIEDTSLVIDRMRAAVERAGRSGVPKTWMVRRDPGPLW
ncbi:MAG TPA: hypothetical protein VFE07_07845 [Marmoricola sp.]|nr:hypothetical protein [Marmoricola sp.]